MKLGAGVFGWCCAAALAGCTCGQGTATCTEPSLWYAPDGSEGVYWGCTPPMGWLNEPPGTVDTGQVARVPRFHAPREPDVVVPERRDAHDTSVAGTGSTAGTGATGGTGDTGVLPADTGAGIVGDTTAVPGDTAAPADTAAVPGDTGLSVDTVAGETAAPAVDTAAPPADAAPPPDEGDVQ